MQISRNKSFQYILVMSANVVAMACGFVISILSTHIMQTSDYGFFKAFQNALQLFAGFSIFGIHYTIGRKYAVITTNDNKKSLNYCSSMLIIYICILLAILTTLASKLFLLFNKSIPEYIVLASYFTITMMMTFYLQQKFQGSNEMIKYSLITAIPQLFLAISFICCYAFDFQIGSYHALMLYLIPIVILNFTFVFIQKFKKVSLPYFRQIIRENTSYGLQLYIGSLFSVTTSQILGLMIASLSGLEQYAYFSLGDSLASPLIVIPVTMATVQFKKSVLAKKLTRKEISVTVIITMVALLSYLLFLNYIMPILLGNRYIQSIKYSNVLVYHYVLMGFGDYFNRFVCAKGKGKTIRNGSIITGVTLILLSAILIPNYEVMGLAVAKIGGSTVYFMLMIYFYVEVIKEKRIKNECNA